LVSAIPYTPIDNQLLSFLEEEKLGPMSHSIVEPYGIERAFDIDLRTEYEFT